MSRAAVAALSGKHSLCCSLGESLQRNLRDSLRPGRVLFACPFIVDKFLFFGLEDVSVCFANGSSHYSVLITMDAVIVTGLALMLILVFEGDAHLVKSTYIYSTSQTSNPIDFDVY